MRVRRFGKSYAHPLAVLILLPVEGEQTRIGVMAGRSVGSAVQRNRAKRMLREAIRPGLNNLKPGWEIIIIARRPILQTKFPEIQDALNQLFNKANLKRDNNG
jgi:ribonuclease P protein component